MKQVDIAYTYEAAVMLALLRGKFKGIPVVFGATKEEEKGRESRSCGASEGSYMAATSSHYGHISAGEARRGQALSYSGTTCAAPEYELTNL